MIQAILDHVGFDPETDLAILLKQSSGVVGNSSFETIEHDGSIVIGSDQVIERGGTPRKSAKIIPK